jgi:hypothetical protein
VSVVGTTFAKGVALGVAVGLGVMVLCLGLLVTVANVMWHLMPD